eukprot:403352777
MGNCFTNSRPEDDLRASSFGPVKDASTQKKNHKNVFKQSAGKILSLFTIILAPEYMIESRVSLGQAAKENTQLILENQQSNNKSLHSNMLTTDQTAFSNFNKSSMGGIKQQEYVDNFEQGKFTFEPNHNKHIQQFVGVSGAAGHGLGHDLNDAGVSFGGAHRLDAGSAHMSFSGNDLSQKNMKSFHQSRNDDDQEGSIDTHNIHEIIKEQSLEEDDHSLQ